MKKSLMKKMMAPTDNAMSWILLAVGASWVALPSELWVRFVGAVGAIMIAYKFGQVTGRASRH